MGEMTTELETRSDAVHGFMLPLGQFLLCNSSYHTETCFTRFLFMSENTNCFYKPLRHIDQNQNRIMEAYNINILNHRNICTPVSGGL